MNKSGSRNSCGYPLSQAMNNIVTLTAEDYEIILRRYIYGETIVSIAKDYGICSQTLNKKLILCFGRITEYKHDSIIVYLQHPKHTIPTAAKRFRMAKTTIHAFLRQRFGCTTAFNRTFYKNVPLPELRKMKAPYEQYVISYLEEQQRNAQPTCSLFKNLTKDERIAKARDINLRVKQNIALARRRRKLELEANQTLKGKHRDPFYGKLLRQV